jgi:UDP-3-O-[3-hydroxymyristoyl] glucosamine N-acyltransferase
LGDGVILTAQTGVSHDIPAGKMISGSPGFDNRLWLRAVVIFQRLPELLKRLDRLEKKLAAQDRAESTAGGDGSPK